jgi:CRP-like cAMP-binding protein
MALELVLTKQTEQKPAGLDPRINLLLAKLDSRDYDALMEHGKVFALKLNRTLFQQDQLIDAIYFPLTGMGSLIVQTDDRPQMEMATVGREGAIGAEVCQSQRALGILLIQLDGIAVRIPTKIFLQELAERPGLQRIMNRYLYAQTRQILYSASCNRIHAMEERCARWVLMTQDRAGQDNFPLTQEFLSHMLGVRRASVNVATGMLKKAGFISYVRGRVTVLDRAGLASAACECYAATVAAYDAAMNDHDDSKLTAQRQLHVVS